jgi:hypothetical protein
MRDARNGNGAPTPRMPLVKADPEAPFPQHTAAFGPEGIEYLIRRHTRPQLGANIETLDSKKV